MVRSTTPYSCQHTCCIVVEGEHLCVCAVPPSPKDVYGHANNVIYYEWFDTVINAYMIRGGVLNPRSDSIVGLCVTSQCNYFESVGFPDVIGKGTIII